MTSPLIARVQRLIGQIVLIALLGGASACSPGGEEDEDTGLVGGVLEGIQGQGREGSGAGNDDEADDDEHDDDDDD